MVSNQKRFGSIKSATPHDATLTIELLKKDLSITLFQKMLQLIVLQYHSIYLQFINFLGLCQIIDFC